MNLFNVFKTEIIVGVRTRKERIFGTLFRGKRLITVVFTGVVTILLRAPRGSLLNASGAKTAAQRTLRYLSRIPIREKTSRVAYAALLDDGLVREIT